MSQQINLFNPIFLKQKKIFTALPMAEALGAIVVGVLLLCWFANQRVADLEQRAVAGKATLAARETRLAHVNQQFAPRQKDVALQAQLADSEAQLAALRDVDGVLRGGALGNTAGYAEYFRALARQNVNGLWLTGLTIVGAGNEIGLQGRAMQATMIPNYISRLTAEPALRGKTFASLKIERGSAPEPVAAAPLSAGSTPALAPYVDFSLQSVQSVQAEGGK